MLWRFIIIMVILDKSKKSFSGASDKDSFYGNKDRNFCHKDRTRQN